VQKLEQEHYQHASTKASESSMASMLNEPYCPPPMVFEKKQAVVPERAFLKKSAAVRQSGAGQQTLKIVKEAMFD